MEENPEIATGTSKTTPKNFWDDAALQLNALGPPFKTGKEWLHTWIQKKYNTKRKLTENKKQQNMTGGGIGKFHALDELDDRVLAVANLEKSVTAVPDSICIGVPNKDHLQQQPGPSKHRLADNTTSSNQPTSSKKQIVTITESDEDYHALDAIEIEDDCSQPQQQPIEEQPELQPQGTAQVNKRPQTDFTKAVLEQNERIIKNLESINELAKTFVNGTLRFQKELLDTLKKK